MKRYIFSSLILWSSYASAGWIDTAGSVEHITTYGHTETILVKLSVNGTDVAECSSKVSFAISKSISEEARARMYSMLLAAQASGRNVRVSYDNVGGCEPWDANGNVFRKIDRLQSQ
jgi:hypothetical protein